MILANSSSFRLLDAQFYIYHGLGTLLVNHHTMKRTTPIKACQFAYINLIYSFFHRVLLRCKREIPILPSVYIALRNCNASYYTLSIYHLIFSRIPNQQPTYLKLISYTHYCSHDGN